jgi:hypothetical protein
LQPRHLSTPTPAPDLQTSHSGLTSCSYTAATGATRVGSSRVQPATGSMTSNGDEGSSPADDAAVTAEDITAGLRPADRQRIEKVLPTSAARRRAELQLMLLHALQMLISCTTLCSCKRSWRSSGATSRCGGRPVPRCATSGRTPRQPACAAPSGWRSTR